LKPQIPWLRVFVEGVVIVELARERQGEPVKLAEELEGADACYAAL